MDNYYSKQFLNDCHQMFIEEAAILIASPFQALCSLEAIAELGIMKPDFYVFGSDQSAEMTGRFLTKKGHEFHRVDITKNAIEAIKLNRKYPKYKYVIVGDYFSENFFLMSMIMIERKGYIIYVDDGNSTLSMIPPAARRRLVFNRSKNIFYKFLLLLKNLKQLKRYFFTFYELENKEFPLPIIKNSLTSIRNGHNGIPHGVFIIGTNSSQLGHQKSEYIGELKTILHYFNCKYPDENIYYCPHRRDLNEYDEVCKILGIELFNTEYSVEIDFAMRGISPKSVIGFGSTALLTLKYMFPDSTIIDIIFHHEDKSLVKDYRVIENEYRNIGIKVLEIEDIM